MSGQQLRTGRLKARTRPMYCESCGVRRTIGEPKARDTWTSRLTLTPEEHDWLLVAAAEYEEVSAECRQEECKHGEHLGVCGYLDPSGKRPRCTCSRYEARGDSNAVDFVDWIRKDVVHGRAA